MTVKKKKTFKFQVILLAYSICSLAVGWESEHCTYDYQELNTAAIPPRKVLHHNLRADTQEWDHFA